MKIHFIGTGSAGTLKNFHTNFMLEQNGKYLLLDCGAYAPLALDKAGFGYRDINAMYISHLHGDHCYGVETIGFNTYFDLPYRRNIKLYANGLLIPPLWQKCLSASMESIQRETPSLELYYQVFPVLTNDSFEWEGINFKPVQSVHIMNGYGIVPSFGVMITLPDGIKIYVTTDTQFAPAQLMDFMKEADLVIADCECFPFKSGVHANYMDWRTFPADIKRKMKLTHYQDFVLNSDYSDVNDEWKKKALDDGFLGFAYPREILDTDKQFINLENLR